MRPGAGPALGLALLLPAAGLGAEPGAEPSGVSFASREPDKSVTVRLGDGLVLKPYYLTDLDQAGFASSGSGGQAAGFNLRRQQLGGALTVADAVELGAVWDFGSSPGGRGRLLEGQASFTALPGLVASAGVLKPQFSMESVQNGGDTPLMERAAIVNATRNLAASSGREALQLKANGRRWLLSGAVTAGITGTSHDGAQRAVVGRALVLPVAQDGGWTLELGASGQHVWRPADTDGTGRAVGFAGTVELAVDDRDSVNTRRIRARNASVAGVEASASWRRLLVQGEYYGIGVSPAAGGPTLRFDGWYLQSTLTLLGSPRRWDAASGTWMPTANQGRFDPAAGLWGTVQATLRFSAIDLNDGAVRGGRQGVWTLGVSYWPVLPLRLMAEVLHAEVSGTPAPRRTNGAGARLQLQF